MLLATKPTNQLASQPLSYQPVDTMKIMENHRELCCIDTGPHTGLVESLVGHQFRNLKPQTDSMERNPEPQLTLPWNKKSTRLTSALSSSKQSATGTEVWTLCREEKRHTDMKYGMSGDLLGVQSA